MGKHQNRTTSIKGKISNMSPGQKTIVLLPVLVVVAIVAGALLLLFSSNKGQGLHDPAVPFPAGMGQYKVDAPVFSIDTTTLPKDVTVGDIVDTATRTGASVTQQDSVLSLSVSENKKVALEKYLTANNIKYTSSTAPVQYITWKTSVPSSTTYPNAEQLAEFQDVLWSNWSVVYEPTTSDLVLSWTGQGLTTAGRDKVSEILGQISQKEVVVN